MFKRKAIALLLIPYLMARTAAALELESDQGMVVTSQHLASEVGAEILRQGGNAIDAAVAVGYALAVTHPC
jgi:gamma-glutamyltranspeptidase/glutathione hydrolase